MSVDWYKPVLHKTAGKSASVGSVAATCLNLPPSFRHRPEYVYLASIIPGPREPSGDRINGYLEVVIEQFKASYEHGTYFSKTYLHPGGILERSIIALFIGDLPGARKCGGMASYSSKQNFCATCDLTLEKSTTWTWSRGRFADVSTFKKHAQEWKDADSITEKKKLFKANGVRWSAFLALPYWDPLQAIIIDGMHNLFLGLCAFHCRIFLEIDVKYVDELNKKQRQIDVKKTRTIQSSSSPVSRLSHLKKIKTPYLEALCSTWKADPQPRNGMELGKMDFINAIQVQYSSCAYIRQQRRVFNDLRLVVTGSFWRVHPFVNRAPHPRVLRRPRQRIRRLRQCRY